MTEKEDLSNDYDQIAHYYDSLMCNGYYSYSDYCKSLLNHITSQQSFLEVGIGTGLLAKEILSQKTGLKFSGLDVSESMLKIAEKRLGHDVELIHLDMMDFHAIEPFDVVISLGASFSFVGDSSSTKFLHSCDSKSQLTEVLQKISSFLKPGGLFFVNLQGMHETCSFQLPEQLVYEQEVEMLDENHFIKRYSFVKDGVALAKMSGKKSLMADDEAVETFQSVDFKLLSKPQQQSDFFVFAKQ